VFPAGVRVIQCTFLPESRFYKGSQGLSLIDDNTERTTEMDWECKDEPLSAPNVPQRLAEIQKRGSDLLDEPDALRRVDARG
jgi:hypothetical protein